MKENKVVVDLSSWNLPNYRSMKEEGVDAVILKAINKNNAPDKRFEQHYKGCTDTGIPVIGAYTYSYANTVSKAIQASAAFINVCRDKDIHYMFLDLEDVSMTGLGHRIIDIINAYRRAAADAGMEFSIYTGNAYYIPYLQKYAEEIADIPLWWARYPSTKVVRVSDAVPTTKHLPNVKNKIDGWQYSSTLQLKGSSGLFDISVWYDSTPFSNKDEIITIPVEYNPFTEPAKNCKLATTGNDANWVLWYLWRFGKLLDAHGNPDASQINGVITATDLAMIKEVQKMLGLVADGIVGKATRAVWKKIC